MAYQLTSSSSQYLSTASAPLSGTPLTIAAYIKPASVSTSQAYVAVQRVNQVDRHAIQTNPTGQAIAVSRQTGFAGFQAASSNNALSVGTWASVVGVFASNSSRQIFVDGTSLATNTDTSAPTNLDSVLIGTRYNPSIGLYADADIAEVGIWNAALTAEEIASLADGMTCDKVRPQSLVFYAPLVRNLTEIRGGLAVTNNNGATVANHPRVYA
jgi:hypothetical protein